MTFSGNNHNLFFDEPFVILVVDDEEYILDFLKEAIQFWGYSVITTQSAAEAHTALLNNRVNLIITDKNMETDDAGLKLSLTARQIYPDIIVFLITGNYVDEETVRFCEKHSISFLQKPLRSNELKILINNTVCKYIREIEFKSDIAASKKIIESTFPRSFPKYENTEFFSLYKPVFDIGGDFYDFVKIDDSKCVFYLCDVQGHGVQSAIFANTIRIFFRAYIATTPDLSEVAFKLNNSMCAETRSNSMATAFFSYYDSVNCEFSYVNAGHEQPLLYRASENIIEELESTGTILAIFENMKYEKKNVKFNKGDILFVYTDGVCDNYDISFQKFQVGRIKEIIMRHHNETVETLGHKIFTEIQKHLGGNPQHDDLAFILVKMK